MKKLLLIIGLILVCGIAKADDISISDTLNKIPGMKQGVAYSIVDSQFNYLSTIDVVKAGDFALEVGYAGTAKNTGDKVVAVASYDVFNAKKAGVTIPIADLIDFRVGLYGGYGRIDLGSEKKMEGNNEWDAGISATAISLKF